MLGASGGRQAAGGHTETGGPTAAARPFDKEFPVPGKAEGRAADLPWLCPNTDSLIGLAERSADLPRLAAADPAFLAFLLRFAPPPDAKSFSLDPSRFAAALLPEMSILRRPTLKMRLMD